MSFDREQFIKDFNRVNNIKTAQQPQTADTTVTAGFDREQFIKDFERVNGKTQKKGQTYSAPVVVQPAIKTEKDIVKQENYNQMQQLFNRSDDKKELARITNEINAISGYGAGADRSNLQNLYQQKDQLEQRLKTGRYDEDLNVLERLQLTGQGIGEGYDAAAGVLVDTAAQAVQDYKANKDNADYQALKDRQKEINAQIAVLEQRAAQGVADAAMLNNLQMLYKERQYLQTVENEDFKTPLNMEADSMQAMQRAMQAQQQATYGMNDTAAFLYNTGASIAENAALMPLAMLPGGQSAILALMGAKSAAQKAVEVGESGGTAADALVRGLSSGLIEAATEKLPLDNLIKIAKGSTGKAIIKNVLKQAGKQAVTEGTEEAVAYIANTLVDLAAKDPNAQFSIAELLYSAAGGALSGSVMGGGASLIGRNNAADTNDGINNVENSAENAINSTENVAKPAENVAKPTENVAKPAENVAKPADIETADRKELEDEVKRIVGIDTRTEAEKVADTENERVALAEEMAAIAGAKPEDVERVRQSAAENIAEAKAKESLESAVELIRYAGKEEDIYSDSRDKAAAYNTAKRIGINLAHSGTTAMGRAVHEVGHDKTQSEQWQNYTAALDRLIATDGRLVKLMDDIDYAYRNSEDAEVRASVSFADGTIDNAKIREEQYLKLTEIMLPNIAKGDKQLLNAIKKDRNVLDNLLDFIRGIKNKVSIKLTKSEAAMLDEAERQLVNLLRSEGAQTEDNGKKYAIKIKPGTNQKYVEADRQIITGNNRSEWKRQLGMFLENKLLRGYEIPVTTVNGDVLYLNNDTIGKALYDKKWGGKKEMTDAEYRLKANAFLHIDEIVKVSQFNKTKPDNAKHQHDKALRDWKYYTAYFMDFDGQYYKVDLAILPYNKDFVYDIGDFEKRKFSVNTGSSSTNERRSNGELLDTDIVSQVSENSNGNNLSKNSGRTFSLAMPVEETKDLVAVHNLEEGNLLSTIELGGFPMPSIAILKAEHGHSKYGDISVVFGKKTIDPLRNEVYGGDAWTPTFPKVEYKIKPKAEKKLRDMYYDMADKYGYNNVKPLYSYMTQIEDKLNQAGSEKALLERIYDDAEIMQVYLDETGKGRVEPIVEETKKEMSEGDKTLSKWIINDLGEDVVKEFVEIPKYESPIDHHKKWFEKYGDKLKTSWEKYCKEVLKANDEQVQNIVRDTKRLQYGVFVNKAGGYLKNKGVTTERKVDYDATDKAIREKAKDGYKQWVDSLFKDIVEKTGLRNNKDTFTASGNRRSWNALHWENTLENIVKAMAEQNQKGAVSVVPSQRIHAVAQKQYNSIEEIKADSNRLRMMDDDAYNELKKEHTRKIVDIASSIAETSSSIYGGMDAMDDAAELIVDAVSKYKTKSAVFNYMRKYNKKVTLKTVDDIFALVNDIANMPTGYFEAKPTRAVGLDEVEAVIIPSSISEETKQKIKEAGMPIVEYDGTEQDRLAKLNSLKDIMFSIQSDIDTNEYWGENSKSRAVERHAVNEFASAVADLLGVEFNDKNEILKKQAWKIADAAKKTGVFDTHQMIDFFENAYNLGKQETGNLDERNKQLKKELHNLGIKPLKGKEYIDFVHKYQNKIRFSHKGTDIDIIYKELVENYPEWFSEDIVNPYDMMNRIGEVYDSIQGKKVSNKEFFGQDAEEFKSLAVQQYQNIVDNFIDTMNSVSRYQLALAEQKKQDETAAKKVYTLEDVKAARELAQPLMKEIARMDRKNLFTAEDRNRLNDLLKLTHPADIERMQESLRATNPLAEDIIAMYEKKKMLEAVKKPIYEYNKQRKARLKSQFLDILQTSDSWKDKGSGLAYMNNTFERNIDDIVTDKRAAEELKDILPRQIHRHVADATRYKNKLRDKIRGFDIDTTKTYNIEVQAAGELLKGEATEADLIQMYGEGIVTKQYLDKIDANTKKIVETADKFREIYNELFEKINEAYVTNGYAPMEYRQDYFPHFFDETGDTLLNKVGQFLGFDAKNMLPTEIAGRTHEFSPGRQWNSHALQRKGEKTDYNVLIGFDNYIEAAANIIHLTEDIQNLRAFENAIRYKYSDEGMKAELDAIDALPISEAEKQEQRERILKTENRNTRLNNFVVWEHEYTNLLAGKKSKADRWIEDMFGRRFYTVAKNIENRVSANMIAGNISSALTNFIPLTQLTAEVDGRYILTAMSDTIKNMKENDGIVDMSDFLTNRFGSEMLSLTTMQKLANKAGAPMALVDEFTSNVVTRARYLQNVDKGGMDSASAMKDADEYAASLMADRSKGALPTIFESKNPLIKLFTMFQVEQANQLNYLFKDLPRKKQEKAKGWMIWALIKLGVFSFLYNWLFEQIAGRKPAFSPVDMVVDTGKDIKQVAKGEKKASAALSDSFVRTMENLPYASSVLAVTGLSEDAGRIPVSGALPDFSQLAYLVDRDVSAEKKKAVAMKELTKPALYLATPFAGGAAKKVVDAGVLYGKNKGVQYSIQSDGSKKVQFANDPSVGAVAQAALFGKWASKPAQEYIDSGFKGLSKNQTKAFEGLKDTGLKNSEAVAMVKGISEADTDNNGYYKAEEAKSWLDKQDLTREQKAILFSCMCPTVKNNPYK